MQKNNQVNREWHIVDLKDKTLGRSATVIANLLRGKGKVDFVLNQDLGDYVVVINAKEFVLTGKKLEQKRYYRHTGYLGHLKEETVPGLLDKKPEEIIKRAVAGMLPHNKLKDKFLKRLKVYTGSEHPHKDIKFKTQG